jgi:glutaredoxin
MKRPFKIGVAVLVVLLSTTCALAQTLYRWVDKDGKVQYSDTPPNSDAKVTQKDVAAGADSAPLPYALQMAMKNNPVTLFVGNSCGEFCANGRALLSKRGIPYAEKNAEVNRDAAEALNKAAGSLTVPTLLVGSNAVTGYTEESWHSALDAAGYPRTKLPSVKLPSPTPPPPPPAAATPPATPEAGGAK